jgi:hypothetical protein
MIGRLLAFSVLGAGVNVLVACGEGDDEPLRFCQSRGVASVAPGAGTVTLEMSGPQNRPIANWDAFVAEAGAQMFSLEICSVITDVDPDWHLLGTWHLEGAAPWIVSTFPPGSYFEGQLKGEANPGRPIIRSFFESVPYESLAPEGHGEVSVYDPRAGAARGSLEVVSHGTFSNDSSTMMLNFDLTWDPATLAVER